ncbi:MAG: CDP-diacylglycerol--glycerol-3-phosphate 3-phosphatidyltransferase [Clostridia bacterium]|nr:CDP-diacylglycerol--glycerol-3-phosphate 3-phosphatidyltransferase [Clostridia bacterium]
MKLNLPNKLTVLRIILVPLCMVFILYPIGGEFVARIIAAALFLVTALTDLADGKIARARNLVTNFGKFLDPLADKFMIFGALLALCSSDMYAYFRPVFVWVSAIIILRELGVTSIRLVASGSSDKVVIAASYLGKLKTTFQCVAVMAIILEPVMVKPFFPEYNLYILSYICTALMLIFTVWSGADYIKSYWKYINPNN